MSPRPRASLACLVVLLVPVFGCQAQDVPGRDGQIAGAVLAAPADLRAGAMVYGYAADGTLVTLREGTNELICLADDPNQEGHRVACYHASLEPYMARGRALRAEGIEDTLAPRHEEADAGTLAMPAEPAMIYNFSADTFDPASGETTSARSFYAVYIPYATSAMTGLPEAPAGPGVPWLMRAGTPSAHIMIIPAQ